MSPMPDADTLLRLHDGAVVAWHHAEPNADSDRHLLESCQSGMASDPSSEELLLLILAQHRANFELWHQEDEARVPSVPDAVIAAVKRAIDRLNQRRNDLVETLDEALLRQLTQVPAAPLHSETPGMIVDRLSILALKLYHTREESLRPSATPAHRARNADRLALLDTQRAELAACLDALLADIAHGRRRFHLYRQMKMYNDPELNPALYRLSNSPTGG